MPSNRTSGKSPVPSWVAVLALALVIYGIIRGLAWLWGDEAYIALPDWLLRIYGIDPWGGWAPWRERVMVAAVLLILVAIAVGLVLARKRSRHPQETERRVLVIGSWALYFPAIFGSAPALIGMVAMMGTPFIAAGLLPVVGVFLPPSMADWVYRGIVGSWDSYDELHRLLTAIAQPIVAAGLSLTIVGFIQLLLAFRHRRLQTKGLYAMARHPQYLGIAMWIFGLALAVNTTAGYMMSFTAIYFCVLVALREETILSQQFGSVYRRYHRSTPFMIPFVKIGLPLPKTGARRAAALIAYYAVGMAVLCLVMGRIGVTIVWFV